MILHAPKNPKGKIDIQEVLAERETNTVCEKIDNSEEDEKLSNILSNLLALGNYKVTITLENK